MEGLRKGGSFLSILDFVKLWSKKSKAFLSILKGKHLKGVTLPGFFDFVLVLIKKAIPHKKVKRGEKKSFKGFKWNYNSIKTTSKKVFFFFEFSKFC